MRSGSWLLILSLLLSAPAIARQPPREPSLRTRTLVAPARPGEVPPLALHVAVGVPTLLQFQAPLPPSTPRLPVDEARIRLVALGPGSWLLLLSTSLAERLRVKVGDVATLFSEMVGGKRNALDVEVVALTEPAGLLGESAAILVSNATLRELGGLRPEAAGVLQLTCAGGVEPGPLDDTFRQALRQAGFDVLPASREAYGDKVAPLLRENWSGQRLDVSTREDEASFLALVTDGLAALTVLVGLIAILVVMVGLFVSLSVSVRERTREIGTLRAMGMHRRSVVGLFLLEGLLMGLLASATGAAVSALLSVLLRGAIPLPTQMAKLFFSSTLPLEPHLPGAVLAVVLVSLGACLASIIPAARAAALSPRSAMESL